MNYVIREANPHDTDDLCVLMSELTGRSITHEIIRNRLEFVKSSPFDSLYVYEEADRVWGAVGFRLRENIEDLTRYGEISVLVVNSQKKRQGIGRILNDFIESLAREQGCSGTWLVSGLGRVDEAYRFYEQLGYQQTGSRFIKKDI